MADFEQVIENAVASHDIPGCVLCATDRDGSFEYTKSFGTRSLQDNSDQSALQPNTIMYTASYTKLMTSICVMQLVERGLASLDEPVYTHVPELKSFTVLTGFNDDGTPIEELHKNPITLRSLLTHTSGLAYNTMHPLLQKWVEYHGKDPNADGTLLGRYNYPLVCEPGTGWVYGCGIDYAGLLIERITNQTLEEYMKENLWGPLGIKDISFFPTKRPELEARLADMSRRDAKSGRVVHSNAIQHYLDVQDCLGGTGAFASAEEYIKILHALLTTDENEKILKKVTVEEFFRPQLNDSGISALEACAQDKAFHNAMGGPPGDLRKDWGLGGLLIMGQEEGGRSNGTMIWGGAPNLIWFVDRKAGLCGSYAGQVLPPGDTKCAELTRLFEAGMYKKYREIKGGDLRV